MLGKFWSEKLGVKPESLQLPEGRSLLDAIRAKTMKQGGVGYVVPGKGSFPLISETNKFILAAGAIPAITWLNGLSDGEKAIEELFEVEMSTGAAALNIIPDRNYTPGVKDEKLKNLYQVAALAGKAESAGNRRNGNEQPRAEVCGQFRYSGIKAAGAGVS